MLFDYTTVTPESIAAEVDAALETADHMIASVVDVSGRRTFANTAAPLERVAGNLADVYGRGAFLGHASPDEAVRQAARAAEERLSKWQVEVIFRDDLFAAVRDHAAEPGDLSTEERRFLDFTMRDFLLAGHELSAEKRQELKALNERLVELSIEFSTNLAEYEDCLIVSPDDLDGLPPDYVERLAAGEEPGTYCVSMAYPDVQPFMENARRRDLRQELMRKFNSRAKEANRTLLEETVDIRRRIAAIFGVPSWAHHRMQEKMAKTPDAVEALYEGLRPPLEAKAQEEIAAIAELLEAETGDTTVQIWDWRYYDTQIRRTEFGLDPMEVAAYFPLDQVVDGMLDLTAEMFGLTYRKVAEAGAWHPDVSLFEVSDSGSGELIGHFYMDLFPREGKFGHAAAWPLVPGRLDPSEGYVPPVSAILANFTKPSPSRPSLLQHGEVVTLFHEFGHILHMTLSRAAFTRFSGAGTEWDFVEAPSQIMEHWCWRPEILSRFAHHHETGEPLPTETIEQLAAARNLNVGILTLRQISFGWFDMAVHGRSTAVTLDDALLESAAVGLFPLQEDTFFPASFGHMYGYDAGYYGYLWAEVFGDDMFSRFEDEGVTNPAVGMEYRRTVLEPNGSKDAAALLADFLGREPSNEAFLRKLGIG